MLRLAIQIATGGALLAVILLAGVSSERTSKRAFVATLYVAMAVMWGGSVISVFPWFALEGRIAFMLGGLLLPVSGWVVGWRRIPSVGPGWALLLPALGGWAAYGVLHADALLTGMSAGLGLAILTFLLTARGPQRVPDSG